MKKAHYWNVSSSINSISSESKKNSLSSQTRYQKTNKISPTDLFNTIRKRGPMGFKLNLSQQIVENNLIQRSNLPPTLVAQLIVDLSWNADTDISENPTASRYHTRWMKMNMCRQTKQWVHSSYRFLSSFFTEIMWHVEENTLIIIKPYSIISNFPAWYFPLISSGWFCCSDA